MWNGKPPCSDCNFPGNPGNDNFRCIKAFNMVVLSGDIAGGSVISSVSSAVSVVGGNEFDIEKILTVMIPIFREKKMGARQQAP